MSVKSRNSTPISVVNPSPSELESRPDSRVNQAVYHECDIYMVGQKFLRKSEIFSNANANRLFKKSVKKKPIRCRARFLLDRIIFLRKTTFSSKLFRKEVLYRDIKYFFVSSENPEYFMFCVVEENMRRQSYEIYRCEDSTNVHTICSLVYKAVEDPRFILQGNPVLKESVVNIRSAGMRSQTPNGASSRTPASNVRENGNMRNPNGFNRAVSSPHLNETNDGRLSQNSSFEAVTHLISTPSRSASDNNVSDLRKRKVGRTKSVSFGTKSQAYVPVSGFSSQSDVYSYYDSPTIAEVKPNEFSGRKVDRPESAAGRIVIVGGLRTGSSNRRDFSAQSACVQKCEATSPILPVRSADVQLTRASSMNNCAVTCNGANYYLSSGAHELRRLGSRNSSRRERGLARPYGAELEAAVMTDSPVTRHASRCRKNLVLYAGSDSIFNRPLRAGEPIYMYVTHMARDGEDRHGSPTSTTSTVSTIRPIRRNGRHH